MNARFLVFFSASAHFALVANHLFQGFLKRRSAETVYYGIDGRVEVPHHEKNVVDVLWNLEVTGFTASIYDYAQ